MFKQHIDVYRKAWTYAGHPGEAPVYLRCPGFVAKTDSAAQEAYGPTLHRHRPRAHPAARSVALNDQNKLAGGVLKDTPFQRLRRPDELNLTTEITASQFLGRKFRGCSAYTKRRTDETIQVRC